MLERGRSWWTRGGCGLGARNRRLLLVWAVVVALFIAPLVSGCGTAALSNDPKNLFAQVEPATVMVQVQVSAHISTPAAWIFNQSKIRDALYAKGLTESSSNWDDERFNLVFNNPIENLDPDFSVAPAATDATSGWWGSGFIADPNGYIVTNAHVAAPPDDEIKSGLVTQGLQKFIDQDVSAWAAKGYSTDELKLLATADQEWMTHYLTVTSQTKTISVVMGANIQGADVAPKEITADVVTAGEEVPGKDVAIIKIEGKNYPTVAIGDDSQVNVGDKLYVIGYPNVAQGGVNTLISTKSVTEPTFTSGVVSAKKQATQGYQVIQTDAAVTHGNSGGPVLDSQGQVVGIATFISIDPSTGQAVQGFNFVMPSTLIKQFLDRSGAKPAQGEFTKLYTQGLTQEAASQYSAAKGSFQQIESLSPGNPYVQLHISQDAAAISSGKDKSSGVMPMIGLGVLVVLVVVAGIAILVASRRKKAPPPIPAQSVVATQQYPPSLGPQTATPLPPLQENQPAESGPEAPPSTAPAAEPATAAAEPGSEVTVLVISPSGTRQIVASLPAIIGLGAGSQIVVDDPEVSPQHAAIARVNGVLEVTDLGGTGGIQVNEDTVSISPLRPGDRIALGHSQVVIQ